MTAHNGTEISANGKQPDRHGFNVEQKFAEGFDPDKISMTFVEELKKR